MKIKRYFPFGAHGTIGNKLNGIGQIWRNLNDLGVPCFYKGADGYGEIFELLQVGDSRGVENITIWRTTRFDVPNWDAATPEDAAEEHVQKILSLLPPEFDKRTWLEIINEPDKDDDDRFPDWDSLEFSNWLGKFMIKVAQILLPQGFKVLGFGYSSGEPELAGDNGALISDWEAPAMLDYLRLCQDNHEILGVALHEYSYQETTFLGDPWLIGRFLKLFDVCDKHGIKRPLIAITEFGATLWKLPIPENGIPELVKLSNNLYAKNPEVLGVALWNFGQGWFGIQNAAWEYLQPMADITKDYVLEIEVDETVPDPVDPVPPSGEGLEVELWQLSLEEQIQHGLQLAPTAIQDAIRGDGFHPVIKEMYVDGLPPFMAAEDWNERKRSRRVYYWKNGIVHWFKDPEIWIPDPEPVPPPDPVDPPPAGSLDLAPYFMPVQEMGTLFELRRADGSQERVQHQKEGNELFITKGTAGIDGKSEFEHLMIDDHWIWRGVDTSPGNNRFYHQYETGKRWARWAKRKMNVLETFVGSGHRVQFFNKVSCSLSEPNSGNSTNIIKLVAHYSERTWNGISVQDVIELHGANGEIWYFAKGLGMVGWESPWNSSFISEIHSPGSRPNNQREILCSYSLP